MKLYPTILALMLMAGCGSTSVETFENDVKANCYNNFNSGYVVVHNDKIYCNDKNYGLVCADLDGRNATVICDGFCDYLNILGDELFWIVRKNLYEASIYVSSLDGSNLRTFFEGDFLHLIAYNDKLYFYDAKREGIFSSNADGSELTRITEGYAKSLVFNEGYLYYVSQNNLIKNDLFGNCEVILENVERYYLYRDIICYYWEMGVMSYNTKSGVMEDLTSLPLYEIDINFIDGHLIFSTAERDGMGQGLYSLDITTKELKKINPLYFGNIHVVGNKLYCQKQDKWYLLSIDGKVEKEIEWRWRQM